MTAPVIEAGENVQLGLLGVSVYVPGLKPVTLKAPVADAVAAAVAAVRSGA